MKIKSLFMTYLLLLNLILVGCMPTRNQSIDIITTLFPQYDIAKQISGDKLSVSLLTPFGTEVHEYGPTAKDIIRIKESKLFLFTSHEMERWVSGILDNDTNAINLSERFTLLPYEHGAISQDEADQMHYWTDPTTILQLITVIKEAIINIDPDNTSYYEYNASAYYGEIKAIYLDADHFFSNLNQPTVFFAGHNAMGAFGNRFNLSVNSLSENFKPDADLTPGQIERLKNQLRSSGSKYLFTEELVEPRAANTIKNELALEGFNITLLELHGYHNISKNQNEQGVSYADLFRQNIVNLKQAFNHRI